MRMNRTRKFEPQRRLPDACKAISAAKAVQRPVAGRHEQIADLRFPAQCQRLKYFPELTFSAIGAPLSVR